ncbi:adenosylmethionine--8-amino-7-oxononanoate transaminase [Vibrio sonorensis]|uniref:adenosylmethionine--8-amino-7-oxononanoate transaminase n=1 Tax=Vibrio sonorensis TaxID=1004316 RepID=UPI0008D971B4|nr:adenosylmethionine--8-amino-7-oxononanoate transaminase [Vibrio sonorensis]
MSNNCAISNNTNVDLDFDRKHIWHPYTSTVSPLTCYPVESAQGVEIVLEDGRKLVDGMSSWWSTIHGYNHPALNQAAKNQIDKMSHVMFGGITHKPAVDLCQKLLSIAPSSLNHVFLSDSGSVAVEVSLKMALQYWHSKGEKRSKFLALRNGYHGDTFAAMSVTDPDNSMHSLYKGFLPQHVFSQAPSIGFYQQWDESCLDDIKHQVASHHTDIAAIILEPIVQGAGGMRIYHPNYLKGVRALCDQYGLLLIADEIATGLGRTGKMFACEHAEIEPDILCIGKAITGGYVTLAATLTTSHVANTVCEGEAGCFMHGPTFMGNPLACSIANASLDLLATGEWIQQVRNIESYFAKTLPSLTKYERVKEVRWLGAIGVVEARTPVNMETIQKAFVDAGVWIRPFGKLIYIMPPYIIDTHSLDKLIEAIRLTLDRSDCFQS